MRRVQQRMQTARHRAASTTTSTTSRSTRTSSPALQHHPDQRHLVLPRPDGLGATSRDEVLPAILARQARRRADPRLERGLRLRRGGLHPRDVLAEALGAEAFRERVKIYATDVDEEALAPGAPGDATRAKRARGRAAPSCASATSSRSATRYVFRKRPAPRGHLRPPRPDAGRADLALDLLVCRNTLMYFNAETQARILARFHFALNGDGGLPVPRARPRCC